MNINKLNTEINTICNCLLSSKMAIDYNFSIYDANQSAVLFKAEKNLFNILSVNNIIDRYKNFVNNRFYNCLLFDGSILQFYYKFNKAEIITHRLCYLPCPINIYSSELEEFSIIEILEKIQLLPQELQNRLKEHTMIRFDYDTLHQSILHPASHFTCLTPNCRIPVCSPISPLMFIQFILNNFYEQNLLTENNIDIKVINDLKDRKSTAMKISKCLHKEHEKIFHINIA